MADRLTLATLDRGGGNFLLTIEWAADAFRAAGFEVEIARAGASGLENCRRLGRGEADVSVMLASGAWSAERGQGAYAGEVWPVRGLALAVHPGHYLFAVFTVESGITSLAQIAQERRPLSLCVPREDFITGRLVQALLRHYGIEVFHDIEAWGGRLETSYLPVGRLIASDQADGIIREGTRLGPIGAATASRDMVVLPFERPVLEQLAAEFGTPLAVLPPRSLRGQTAPLETVDTTGYALIVNASMPDERAYQLARALNEASARHWIAEDIFYSPRHAPETGASLHPGAARYYRELGLLF